jgi:hypothetical protein
MGMRHCGATRWRSCGEEQSYTIHRIRRQLLFLSSIHALTCVWVTTQQAIFSTVRLNVSNPRDQALPTALHRRRAPPQSSREITRSAKVEYIFRCAEFALHSSRCSTAFIFLLLRKGPIVLKRALDGPCTSRSGTNTLVLGAGTAGSSRRTEYILADRDEDAHNHRRM